jgi:hypothetical protein
MALYYDQALDQLAALRASGNLNESSLRNLISSLDVSASGSLTVLYSGPIGDISSAEIAATMASDPNLRVIDKTEAAKFLDVKTISPATNYQTTQAA